MAERYLFFNSMTSDRRKYRAQDFADYFGSVLSTGLLHVNESPGMQVVVEPETLNTIVSIGKSIMKGHLYENTTPLTLAHQLPETSLDRIDRVVLRLNLSNAARDIKLHVSTGEPSLSPEPPSLIRTQFIYEISLARVLVRANTVKLLPSDLTDERLDEEVCGIVSSLISVPTNVFNQQFATWLSDNQRNFDGWFAVNELEFMTWFNSVKDILDTSAAGNLLLLIQKNEADIKSIIKIKKNVLILASSWISVGDSFEYTITDIDVSADSMVDVNIHVESLDSAKLLLSANNSFNGALKLYSEGSVTNNITVDYRITKEVI